MPLVPNGPTGAYSLLWNDEFSGEAVDMTKWEIANWKVNNVTPTPSNMWLYLGRLTLNLASASVGAAVIASHKFLVGQCVEARVRFPGSDTGDHIYNFPAFWTAGVSYPDSGEHDIAEGLGNLKISYWDKTKTLKFSKVPPGDWNNAYHNYTLLRHATHAHVYWDGVQVARYDTNDDGGPQHIILNVGSSPKRDLVVGPPSRVRAEYVRVWGPA